MTWDTETMAELPPPDDREFAQRHGYICGKRGFAESENPWREEPKGPVRVLHFRWRRGYAEGLRERQDAQTAALGIKKP